MKLELHKSQKRSDRSEKKLVSQQSNKLRAISRPIFLMKRTRSTHNALQTAKRLIERHVSYRIVSGENPKW